MRIAAANPMVSSHRKPRRAFGRPTLTLVAALLTIGVLSLIAASRLKRWVKASSEAQAIADTREVLKAEESYASANFGLFDDLPRLCRRGPECQGIGIPGYPFDRHDFLDEALARRSPYSKDHFEREWIGMNEPRALPKGASRTSVLNYCYRATPRGLWVDGAASLMGNETGAIYTNDGRQQYCRDWGPLSLEGEPIACPLPACIAYD